LAAIERRVLWLATSIVHHANHRRETRSGLKVGGHQASSASMTSIMTALYFAHLSAGDRVSVKPHAAPVLHAISYLLGRLDPVYLTQLRRFGGLQSYPSRAKDPVAADFSTGSVGIGATAPIWSSIARRYVGCHFDAPPTGRQIALLGDAELDEGACWEAIVDPVVATLGDVLWVVDVNRQSLDRILPQPVSRLVEMFEAAGWRAITLKYGRRLEALFERDGGDALRHRVDAMENGEYQALLRASPGELRDRLPSGKQRSILRRLLAQVNDSELVSTFRDLGGHDLELLLDAYREADAINDRPTVIFAHTIKGRGLPTEGHPNNHSALLTEAQWADLAVELGANPDEPWATFQEGTAEAAACRGAAERVTPQPTERRPPPSVPHDLARTHSGSTSTQQTLGRILLDLARVAPDVGRRVVTVSPDVASSTNLGGWINKTGIWNPTDRKDWFADDAEPLLRWRETPAGQHIELGIAEVNLVSLLGELGSTWSRDGEPLFPVGTLYDPFVTRALEPWSFGIYAGGQSILIGTPSGVTLAPEGGAHQSIITPSIGIEQPRCIAWEPAFAQDLEWTFLYALSLLGKPDGSASYFRLSTRTLAQEAAAVPPESKAREQRRQEAIAGGYRLREGQTPELTLVGVGAVMTEVLAAADILEQNAIAVDVVCLTSPDLVFRALQARQGLLAGSDWILDRLFPDERASPIIAVLDGHAHTLSFLSAIRNQPIACLGVSDFGQSGDIDDLYQLFGLDTDTIVGAALDLLQGAVSRE
jgi:pyruvate dehydrogenase E1 component